MRTSRILDFKDVSCKLKFVPKKQGNCYLGTKKLHYCSLSTKKEALYVKNAIY